MAAYAFGQSVVLPIEFDVDANDGNGPQPTDPPDGASGHAAVNFRYIDPLGAIVSAAYDPASGIITRTGIGTYQVILSPGVPGIWRYRWYTTAGTFAGSEGSFTVTDSVIATSTAPPGMTSVAMTPAAGSYPYPTGYAQVQDIEDRISAGAWNAGGVSAIVNNSQASEFLLASTAAVDAVLAKSGYTLPLTVAPGHTQIGWQAWALLKNATATLAAAMVENTRHSSNDASQDSKPNDLYQLADDLLVRLETGADNLTAFGVVGGFAPEIDPSVAAQAGGATDPSGADSSLPFFTRDMTF